MGPRAALLAGELGETGPPSGVTEGISSIGAQPYT